MKLKQAQAIAGKLGKPSKMPGLSYGLPAGKALWVKDIFSQNNDSIPQYGCNVGGKLVNAKGSTCASCYALKGRYIFNNVKQAQYNRLKGVFDPQWVDAMVDMLYLQIDPAEPYFRWHDSGDILSLDHLVNIVEVCRRTKYVRHWLPTREAGIIKQYLDTYGDFPKNLTVRLSATKLDGKPAKWYNITSTVHKADTPIGRVCPAPKQGGQCGECRACWKRSVKNVSYGVH